MPFDPQAQIPTVRLEDTPQILGSIVSEVNRASVQRLITYFNEEFTLRATTWTTLFVSLFCEIHCL